MQTEKFIARNVKCNGCVTNIKKNLLLINGVTGVNVTLAANKEVNSSSNIEVYGSEFSRAAIIAKLTELGYPIVG